MPRGDGTGPQGLGPMTGRGLGYCAGYSVPGFANPIGYGLGRGMAWGRGGVGGRGLAFRRGRGGFAPPYAGFYPPRVAYVPPVVAPFPPAPVDEEALLKNHLTVLEEQLAAVKARLEQIAEAKSDEE